MSRSPDFEARREKREFVVFNWIVGKFVAGTLLTFSGKEQNRIGTMYVAGALGNFRRTRADEKRGKANRDLKRMLNLPRLIRIIHLLHCGIVQRTNDIYDTSTTVFPALLTS